LIAISSSMRRRYKQAQSLAKNTSASSLRVVEALVLPLPIESPSG